ncbi:site-2 protease family protein [Algihabitans albus]|uniref:site-2 protease family protein n=1 Tax=Algihabitans albus TaxID=2164067 RepID=UPI000E5CD37D|nr:site-2 protease family protein [Algihabitans albus]
MFGKTFNLFDLFGFRIQIDVTWLFLALLVTWSLAVGFFPALYPGLGETLYLSMAIVGMIGLGASLILHEAAHALVARAYGLPIKYITLFIFGGVAQLEREPETARSEFLMAIAGPLMSLALAGLGYLAWTIALAADLPQSLAGVLYYLFLINLLLGGFNMIPAFPLDGGRALRALLWGWRGDLLWATKIAATSGSIFAFILIGFGILRAVSGDLVGGVWMFLIGLFVRAAAQGSYSEMITHRLLDEVPVTRFLHEPAVSVPADLSIEDFVQDYVYVTHADFYPVVEGRRLVGSLAARQLRRVPKGRWRNLSVADVMTPLSRDTVVGPSADVAQALTAMRRTGRDHVMVAEGAELRGVVALSELQRYLSFKLEIEQSG